MASNNTTHSNDLVQISKSTIDDLAVVTERFLLYLPLIFLLLGLIGFIGNLFTYLQAELRSNTFCIYSLCGSIVDIITLFVNLFPNYLSAKYGIIMWYLSSLSCKVNLFLLVFLPHLSLNFLLMSTIDRFASTCNLGSPLRRINQLKMVPLMISITVIYSCLTSIQAPILFDYTFGFWCTSTQPTTYAVLYIVFNGLMPPLMMFTVILLAGRNVRRSRRRVGAVNNINQRRSRNQFVITIITQVLVTGFLSLQWIIMYMYYTITADQIRSAEETSIIFFVLSLTNDCFYLNYVKSFYLSILTCRLFRKTFHEGLVELLPRYMRPRFHASQTNHSMATVTRMRCGNAVQR